MGWTCLQRCPLWTGLLLPCFTLVDTPEAFSLRLCGYQGQWVVILSWFPCQVKRPWKMCMPGCPEQPRRARQLAVPASPGVPTITSDTDNLPPVSPRPLKNCHPSAFGFMVPLPRVFSLEAIPSFRSLFAICL